jgi:hypothetical protein
MKLYIGKLENCDELLKEISQHEVAPSHGHLKLSPENAFYEESERQTKMLSSVGYDDTTVEYRHYQSEKHFDKKWAMRIAEIVGATPLMCWVSEIRPGKCTPWHWDINPWENEHKQLGTLIRYFCFVSAPAPGHVFVTESDCYYNEPQGSIYQYEDIHAWHAGSNVGIKPKYLLTFTGYLPHS